MIQTNTKITQETDRANDANLQSQPTTSSLPRSEQTRQLHAPSTVNRGRTIPAYFETDEDKRFTVTQGGKEDTFALSDLEYRSAANNWINTRSGRFIKKDIISRIRNQCRNPSAHLARAMLATPFQKVEIPKSHLEAMNSTHRGEWKAAEEDEMNSLKENQVFEVLKKSMIKKKPVSSKWVYTVKYKQDGSIDKFKARVVARGFTQIYGQDYNETYCSVVQIMSTRLILDYAALKRLVICQFDIKTAFLYGSLKEEIHMDPPEGYGNSDEVWRLKRSLYGLKQSPRNWNHKFSDYMKEIGFQVSRYDTSVFYKREPYTIVIVYVDDGLVFSETELSARLVLEQLRLRFATRQLEVTVYRGLEIEQQTDGIVIHQTNYTRKLLDQFGMNESTPVRNPGIKFDKSNVPLAPHVPYRQAIGSLMYLSDTSRPDISFIVNQLARRMASPREIDWKSVKHLFRYLRGTINVGIKYYNTKRSEYEIIGYSDSDFAGDEQSSKSTTGYVMLFNGAPFHWKTQLQKHITLSSTEAEVIALCTLSKEMSWIRRMAIELKLLEEQPALVLCDNQSSIRIAKSEKATSRTRHLRAQNAYICEQMNHNELVIQHVRSANQLADMLTKSLPTGKYIKDRDMLLVKHDLVIKQKN